MKATLIVTGLLAATALAQQHGHGHGLFHRLRRAAGHVHGHQHDKRAIKTEWVYSTVYETVTEIIDDKTTQTIRPTHKFTPPGAAAATTRTPVPGHFLEPAPNPPAAPPKETPAPAPAPPAPQAPPAPSAPSVPVPPPAPPSPPPAPKEPEPVNPPAPVIQVAQPAAPAAANARSGELTFFKVGLGSCGYNDAGKDNSENIVALSHLLMGEQSNGNPMCGKTITVSYGGKTVQAVVRDKCMGCAVNNIDGTEKLFTEFEPLSKGRFEVKWWFNE